jgi:hypothetical protein
MTVARPVRPPTPLEIAKEHVERAFDAKIAKRLDTFKDGTFYVTAGGWARLLAWLVDFVVFVLCVGIGLVALMAANPEATNGVVGMSTLGLLVGVPVLLGLFFGNGRALGAVLTGTRLVRARNGGRIGAAAWWAMLVRTVLLPLFLGLLIAVAAAGGGGSSGGSGSPRRISIDDDATRRLHAAGFLRLDAPNHQGG